MVRLFSYIEIAAHVTDIDGLSANFCRDDDDDDGDGDGACDFGFRCYDDDS